MNNTEQPARACPLPRWPQVTAKMAVQGWKVYHLARALNERPSDVWAWLYGRHEMPHHLRRRVERLLGLAGGSLS